jgi:hypothetical protein
MNDAEEARVTKREDRGAVVPSPSDGLLSRCRLAQRQRLDGERPMLAVAAQPAATQSTLLRRQRWSAGRPYRGGQQDVGQMGHSQCGDFGTESAVIAVAGIEQANSARQTARASPAQLLQRDLRLGLEFHLCGNAALRLR